MKDEKETFGNSFHVPNRYKKLFANGIVSMLEMDRDRNSAWCLDLEPIVLYKRRIAGEEFFMITFHIKRFDKHPTLRLTPEVEVKKFVGKTMVYNPYGK